MRTLNKAKRLLKNKDGSSVYIELTVLFLVCMMLLSLSISFLNVYAKHNLVNTMAHELARYVEIKGQIDNSTYAEFNRLKTASGFGNATVNFDRSGKLSLEESFTVTVSVRERFGIGSVQVIPVTVKAVATGRSEVYWK